MINDIVGKDAGRITKINTPLFLTYEMIKEAVSPTCRIGTVINRSVNFSKNTFFKKWSEI